MSALIKASRIGLVQTAYYDLQQPIKILIDVAIWGALMGNPINEARALLKKMALNNYNWASEYGNPRKRGRHEVNAFTMLTSKVDDIFQKVDRL